MLCECGCGLEVTFSKYRPKRFVTGHNSKGKTRKPRVDVRCEHCGNTVQMTAAAAKGRKYCSNECRDQFRRERTGTLHPRYKRVERVCSICSTPFVVQPKRLQRGREVYCSMVCGREGRRRKISGAHRMRHGDPVGKPAAKERDGFACRLCGFDLAVHAHHIVPRRNGGSNKLDNLITLCPNHHALAHAGRLSVEELRNALPSEIPARWTTRKKAKETVNYRLACA